MNKQKEYELKIGQPFRATNRRLTVREKLEEVISLFVYIGKWCGFVLAIMLLWIWFVTPAPILARVKINIYNYISKGGTRDATKKRNDPSAMRVR